MTFSKDYLSQIIEEELTRALQEESEDASANRLAHEATMALQKIEGIPNVDPRVVKQVSVAIKYLKRIYL